MRNWLLWAILPVTVVVMLIGCEMLEQPSVEPAVYTPVFDYKPPAQAKPGSAGITFGVINAVFTEAASVLGRNPQFKNLPANMGNDFNELLIAKGYNVRGPFANADERTFQDKRDSDLALLPKMDISLSDTRANVETVFSLSGPSRYDITGKVVVSARITLEVRESMTWQLLWSKSIALPDFEVPYKFREYSANMPSEMVFYRIAVLNEVAKGLETQYSKLMETAWKHLEPAEMVVLKKQVQEIREKSGFGVR